MKNPRKFLNTNKADKLVLWKFLFPNMTIPEAVEEINEIFIDPRYEIIVEGKVRHEKD